MYHCLPFRVYDGRRTDSCSLTEADGIIELDEKVTSVEPGDLVNFIPFSSFGL
ncbi:MAG: hypothetical protein GY927_08100 [bacterium]|nr:hypothetical protein [bacterium]